MGPTGGLFLMSEVPLQARQVGYAFGYGKCVGPYSSQSRRGLRTTRTRVTWAPFGYGNCVGPYSSQSVARSGLGTTCNRMTWAPLSLAQEPADPRSQLVTLNRCQTTRALSAFLGAQAFRRSETEA